MRNTSRLLPLFLALAAGSTCSVARAQSPQPAPISALDYVGELQRVEDALRAEEGRPTRSLRALEKLEAPRLVTRPGGASMRVGGRAWAQRHEAASSSQDGDGRPMISRREVEQARQSVEAHRLALSEWASPQAGKYLEPDASAKAAVLDWEKRGVIETGPPAWQRGWLSFVRWAHGLWEKLLKWLGGLFERTPGRQAAPIDPKKIELLFYLALGGVVAGAAWLTWRALGGRVRRGPRRPRDTQLEGEDAALLRLPPNELLARAAQLAREGNFREALRHRYLSLLLQLDARGVWRYDRRRTNWEHIARLKGSGAQSGGVDALSTLTLRFDRVRYGNESCSPDAWAAFERDAQATLEQLSRGASHMAHEVAR